MLQGEFHLRLFCQCLLVPIPLSDVAALGRRGDFISFTAVVFVCQSLQQLLSGRQNLQLGQLLKVRGRIICSQQSDATLFGLSWSSVCPSVGLDVQAVRAVPIIPTALLRSLTSTARPLPRLASCQKG